MGAVYLTFDNSNPSTIWTGTTWTQIAAGTFLVASGTNYNLRATGGAASVTLTSAQSGVPAHAHGLNSHVHSVGAHAHGLNNHVHSVGAHAHGLNSHKHTYDKANTPTGSTTLTAAQSGLPAHNHKGYVYYGSTPPSDVTATTGSGLDYSYTTSKYVGITVTMFNGGVDGGAKAATSGHTHTIGTTSTNSGAASGNTANSTAFDTGAASGNTANSTAFNTGAASGNTANNTAANASSAHENRPPYMAVAMWERTA